MMLEKCLSNISPDSTNEMFRYEYKVEMLQHNGNRNIANVVREFASDFEVFVYSTYLEQFLILCSL